MKFKNRLPTANVEQMKTNLSHLRNAVSASQLSDTSIGTRAAPSSAAPVAAPTSSAVNPVDFKTGRLKVDLPSHLYIPEGAQSIDARRVMNVPAGTINLELIRFVAPQGSTTRFIGYGVFNDGNAAADYRFQPLIDGARILPYHGDPMNNFKIDLGLAPDLGNESLIPCQITMMPGQVLQWLITNTSAVDTSMGIRMIGYFDMQQMTTTPRFG